jgi:GAF domain-containing protein
VTTRPDLAESITAAARSMNEPLSLEETLQRIVEVARDSVPGFDAVGISTVDKHGKAQTRAKTGELVDVLDAVQYGLGEGPCVDTLRGADVVIASRIRHDQRWPRYVPQAIGEGLRSQLAVRLFLANHRTVGGINFYSTFADEVDHEAESIASLFAEHAAIALTNAGHRENLNRALHSRKVVGQAIGILMERYGLHEDQAFAFLVRASSTKNTKLRDVAQELVDQCNTDRRVQD